MLSKREAGSFLIGALIGGAFVRWSTHAIYLSVIAGLIIWHFK